MLCYYIGKNATFNYTKYWKPKSVFSIDGFLIRWTDGVKYKMTKMKSHYKNIYVLIFLFDLLV